MKLRILEICKNKNITQKALAEQIGLSAVGLSKAINGNPTLATLEKIADALEVPVTDMFDIHTNNTLPCPNCGAKLELTLKK